MDPHLTATFQRIQDKQRRQEKEDYIASLVLEPSRVGKSEPILFKFPLFKVRPRKTVPLAGNKSAIPTEHFEFNNVPKIVVDVRYAYGELGMPEKLLLTYIRNQFHKRYAEYKDKGYLEFTAPELAFEIGLSQPRSASARRKVHEGLKRLACTNISYQLPGYSEGGGVFHLIEFVQSPKAGRGATIKVGLGDHLRALFERGFLTSVDRRALMSLQSPLAQNLFLFLYDISQWMTNPAYRVPIKQLLRRVGGTIYQHKSKDTLYDDWNRTRSVLEQAISEMERVGKFLRSWEVSGEGPSTVYLFHFSTLRSQLEVSC